MIRFPFDNFAKTKEGARYIKDADIENFAEEVLEDYNKELLEAPRIIDWNHFLEFYLKCNILFADIHCEDASNIILGATSFDDAVPLPVVYGEKDKTHIELNTGDIVLHSQLEGQPQRLRFTACHEGGHWMLHSEYYFAKNPAKGQMSLFGNEQKVLKCCRRTDIEPTEKKRRRDLTPEEHLEHQANVFSAAILVPRKVVCRILPELMDKYDFAICRTKYDLEEQNDKKWKIEEEIAAFFGVSHQVAQIRLDKMGVWTKEQKQKTFLDEENDFAFLI